MMNSELVKSSTTPAASPVATGTAGIGEVSKGGDRLSFNTLNATFAFEETLIVDDRTGVRPAQTVENKLSSRLKEATLPVSHLQMRGMLRSR
ncbi:hypothetical protein [Singulisphaera sp. PoT]|uniref:hypothetical protein n=1 Tax=Singulisphaera sp. PoT TaxID=3411797 RepID=UPI003BF4849E